MPKYVIQIKGLKRLKNNFSKAPTLVFKRLTKAVNKSALIITEEIKEVTPVKTGALKGSIRPTFGRLHAVIQPNKNYAIFVHEGTKSHEIRPRTKKALFWKGALHPVKRVMHPGTKGVPFMQLGLDESKKNVENEFNKEINNILLKISKI